MRRAFDIAVAAAVLVARVAAPARSRSSRSAWSRAAARSTASAASACDGREFDVLKLRTMVDGAEHIGAGLAVDAGDARITRVGALLRRTSLDELPNLVNVLRGEMAIIGPRPTVPSQVAQYTERQRGRLAVRPGHHRLGAGQRPRVAAVGERIELDLWYIEHRSLAPGPRRSSCAARAWSSAATASTRARPAAGRRAVSAARS